MTSRLLVGSGLALLVACGGDVGNSGGADGGGGDDVDGGFVGGTWQVERATTTDGTISVTPSLAVLADGTVWLAFMEPEYDSGSGGNINVASRGQASWSPVDPLTSDPTQQAFAALSADGDALDLVWNGRAAVDDPTGLFYARYQGSWTPRVDLTAAHDGGQAREALKPALVRGVGGDLTIAYVSRPEVGDAEIRVATVSGDAFAAAPAPVIAPGFDCDAPAIAIDDAGTIHVAATCGPLFDGDVYYTNNSGGAWAAPEVLPASAAQPDDSVQLAIGGDGFTVIAVWTMTLECAGSSCGEIAYSERTAGGWSAPAHASGDSDSNERSPVLVVDGGGVAHIGFHRFNGDNYADIVVASKGAAASETVLTPGTDASDEWMARGATVGPDGAPHFAYVALLPGSEPLNAEIFHAFIDGGAAE